MITITKKEIDEIVAILEELPIKHAKIVMPLVHGFRQREAAAAKEAERAKAEPPLPLGDPDDPKPIPNGKAPADPKPELNGAAA